MKVFYGFGELPRLRHPVVTVGSYDGVHLGHRALIERLVSEAKAVGGESVVLTFEPHPRITLGRAEGLRLLTPLEEKSRLLEALGVDHLVVIAFDKAFSALSGAEFVRDFLVGRIGAETLVAGYNHRFGRDRIAGTEVKGLRVVEVGECLVGGRKVSSTAIRNLIEQKQYAEAERLLGRPLKIGK